MDDIDESVFDTTGLKNFKLGEAQAEPNPEARAIVINTLATNPGREVTIDQFVAWRIELGMSRDWLLDLVDELVNDGLLISTEVENSMAWKVTTRTVVLDRWTAE